MAAVSEPMTADPSQHRQELIERLDSLRRNVSFCDVTVTAKGEEFKAHKAVLAAASPFFLSLLESNMRESNEQLIRIELEEATASVMEDVLRYVYTGNVSVTEESGHNLIATADYLLLPGLKTAACDFLKENVTIGNCVFNYYFADNYQCVELKVKCREVINSNFSVVMATVDFLNLDVKQVMEWVASDDVIVSAEEEVFKGIVKWVSHNKSERESYFPELLRQVRLISISQDFLLNELVKEELVAKNSDFCLNFVLDAMKVMANTTERPVTQMPRKCLETHTDAIFVCGGQKALCFFPQNNLWYRLADTLLEHEDHAVTQFREKIYITGGQSGVGNNSHVTEFYIPSANSWGAFQRKNTLTSFTSLTVLKDCLYATAGGPSSLGQTYKCNPEENYWEVLEGQPQYDQRGSCVVADDKHLYIIGGSIDLFTASILVVRFDPVESKWEQISPMNEERLYAFGVARNGMIYVAGGQERHRTLNTCEVYNPATDEWHIMPRLKVPRRSASMVCFKEELYVIGGFRNGQATVCELSVEGFDFETNEWKKKSHIPVKYDTPQQKEKNDAFKGTPGRIYRAVIAKLKHLKNLK